MAWSSGNTESLVSEPLTEENMGDQRAKLVCEIQAMTEDYYQMRKKTHAWYKVVRAENAGGMVTDYLNGLAADA